MLKIKNLTTLRDTLHNLATDSGASDDYAKGITVGVVGALMAAGATYNEARLLVWQYLPLNCRENFAPESWTKRGTRRHFADAKIQALVMLAEEGLLAPYEALLTDLKASFPELHKQFISAVSDGIPGDDLLWSVFNCQPGGSEDDVREILDRIVSLHS